MPIWGRVGHTERRGWWGAPRSPMPARPWTMPTANAAATGRASDLDQSAAEYAVKAAFLYDFTRFVEWPAGAFSSPATPIDVCVVGRNPFDSLLDEAVHGKTVNGRDIRIRRVASGISRRAATWCSSACRKSRRSTRC